MSGIAKAIPNRNVGIFYVMSIISGCVFINSNWIFFWLRYMTYGQLGVVDASAFAFGLFMEVPTGAISDLIGKKKTMLAAAALNSIGIFLMATANDLFQIAFGFYIAQMAWALFSGASEAMAYDSLKERGQETQFERVIANANRLIISTVVVTTLIGGVLYTLDFRLPHYAWSFVNVIGFIAALFLTEPAVDSEKFSLRNYFHQLGEGFRQLGQPALRPFVPLIFATLGIFYMFSFGLLQPTFATQFGFMADGQAVVYAVLGVMSAVAVGYVPALRKRFNDLQGLALLAIMLALGFLGGALPLGYAGFFAILLIRLAGGLAQPWVSVLVNSQIPSKYRATTLSTVALLVKIPYVATAILAAALIEAGNFPAFNVGVVCVIVALLVGSLLYYKSQNARVAIVLSERDDL